MDYRELTEQEYYDRLRIVVIGAEGLHARAQDVGDGMATIGYGYTFNRGNNASIWRNSGIPLTPQELASLEAIDRAPAADRTRLGLAFPRTLTVEEGDQLLRASVREYEGPAEALSMPLSEERVALVSLTYNRGEGALMGNPARSIPEHPIMGTIRDGDRAEAWFQMRYNCWGSADAQFEGGLRKRRFAEAQVFGLYDDPDNVSPQEAQGVVRMYALHRNEIDRVEQSYGVSIDGESARRNRISEANRDYPALVGQYGSIQNISDALEPAREALLSNVREENPALAERLAFEDLPMGRIFADPGRDLRQGVSVEQDIAAMRNQRTPPRAATIESVGREQRNSTTEDLDPAHMAVVDSRRMTRGRDPQEIDSNDLLLGNGGDDALRGGRGDDVLIGGAGRDRLEGGQGRDLYLTDAGDTIVDADGLGEVRMGGQLVTGGRLVEGQTDLYRSEDGRFTFRTEAAGLRVTDASGAEIRIENFRSGGLGITLDAGREQRGDAQIPAGEQAPERQRMIEDDRPRDNSITPDPMLQPRTLGRRSDVLDSELDPRSPDHPGYSLNTNIRTAVTRAEAGIGKAWADDSEALTARLYGMALGKGFSADDHFVVAFNERTATRQSGEIAFLQRVGVGASVDPYENRVQVATGDLRNASADETYRNIAAAISVPNQAAEVQQELVEQQRSAPRIG